MNSKTIQGDTSEVSEHVNMNFTLTHISVPIYVPVQGIFRSLCAFSFPGSHWHEVKFSELPTLYLVVRRTSTDGLNLILNIWAVTEQGTWLCHFFVFTKEEHRPRVRFITKKCARCWNSHMFMCSVVTLLLLGEVFVWMERNVQETLDMTCRALGMRPNINQPWVT